MLQRKDYKAVCLDDRRAAWRFPIGTDLCYGILQGCDCPLQHKGLVADISSKALAFRTDEKLVPGWRIQVSIAWPLKLESYRLNFGFEGDIIRVKGDLVVVAVERPEFHAAGSGMSSAREEIAIKGSSIMAPAIEGLV